MKAIYKYILTPSTPIPLDAKVLHVGMQDGKPCLWAIVNPNSYERRAVVAFATGHTFEDNFLEHWEYIGTAIGINGMYVFHFFIAKV